MHFSVKVEVFYDFSLVSFECCSEVVYFDAADLGSKPVSNSARNFSHDKIINTFLPPSADNIVSFVEFCEETGNFLRQVLEVSIRLPSSSVRLLIDLEPIKGIENTLALGELQAEIDARGLSDRVEIRPFSGLVHAKDALIDDQFLIVGSHNFHWSAWGEGQGLAEYSLGVADPQAISDFERYFEYQWERAGDD